MATEEVEALKKELGLTTIDEGTALNLVGHIVKARMSNEYRQQDRQKWTLQQFLDRCLISLFNERLLWRDDLSFVAADDGKTFRWAKRPIPPEA